MKHSGSFSLVVAVIVGAVVIAAGGLILIFDFDIQTSSEEKFSPPPPVRPASSAKRGEQAQGEPPAALPKPPTIALKISPPSAKIPLASSKPPPAIRLSPPPVFLFLPPPPPPPTPPPPPPTKSGRPVLKNIGFNLEKYDSVTGKAGDILFLNKIGDHYENKIFLEFGQQVVGPEGPKRLPHPTYILPLGTKIFSPVHGKIQRAVFQARDEDYELIISPADAGNWAVSFDHIINLTVKEGDSVKAGEVLGEVARANSSAIPGELGWTELQIWESSVGEPKATCPFLLLDEAIRSDIQSKITDLARDWEKFIGKNVYREEKWSSAGCLFENEKEFNI